jgi:hypothetical protein
MLALEDLRKARISVMDLLLAMLGGEFSEFYSHRMAFLCDRLGKKLRVIQLRERLHV